MTSQLRLDVLDFIDRARMQPARASDPEELRMLEDAARQSWEGSFTALSAPIAPYTWENRSILYAATATSERVNFRLPFAVEIVGMKVSLLDIQADDDGRAATMDAIDVAIDVNSNEFLTTLNGVSTPGGQRGGTFVTLSAIDIQAPRNFGLRLQYANPDLGFTFRWKNFNATTPIYRDTLIGIALYVRNITGRTGLSKFTMGSNR